MALNNSHLHPGAGQAERQRWSGLAGADDDRIEVAHDRPPSSKRRHYSNPFTQCAVAGARDTGKPSPWLTQLLKRKSPKLAAVALANKTARIAWKMMVTGETYTAKSTAAAG
jgi:transposase